MDENKPDYPLAEPLAKDYETLSRHELLERLSLFIGDLLEHNFEKLCAMIYRHDVSEKKFHKALLEGPLEEQSWRVAELVLEREMEKVKTRLAYRKERDKNSLTE